MRLVSENSGQTSDGWQALFNKICATTVRYKNTNTRFGFQMQTDVPFKSNYKTERVDTGLIAVITQSKLNDTLIYYNFITLRARHLK